MPGQANPALDAFGRARSSEAVTLFDYQSQYSKGPLFWEEALTGAASATHRPDEASVRLAITAADGDKALRQTREYLRYQPGKSQFIITTFNLGPAVAGARKEVGYGDDENGVFLCEENGAVSLVMRSNVTGTPVDTVVAEDDWNAETSVGPSVEKKSIDWTKTQIFGIDMEWLGVGRVRTFLVIDGAIFYLHVFDNANLNPTVYMTTANLPVRYQIAGNTAAAGVAYMDAICTSVASEGGFERSRGIPFSANTGATPVAVTTRIPLLSIRPALTFNSIVNRVTGLVNNMSFMAQTKPVLFEVVYNGTLTSPSWAAADSNSAFEKDVAASAISGGIVISSVFVPAALGATAPGAAVLGLLSRLPLTVNIAGDAAIPLSLVATSLDTAANVSVALDWQELG